MPTCENDYDKAFQVLKDGKIHTFDGFECTIAALARLRRQHHGARPREGRQAVLLHHCAGAKGATGLRDRA